MESRDTTLIQDRLNASISEYTDVATKVTIDNSLLVAARRLDDQRILAVVDEEGFYVGAITPQSLAAALLNSPNEETPCSAALDPRLLSIDPLMPVVEGLRRSAGESIECFVVVSPRREVIGIWNSSHALGPQPILSLPPVGGMATPFGVYLTTGSHRAGAKWYGLMATGAVLMLIIFISSLLVDWLSGWAFKGLAPTWQDTLSNSLVVGLFLLGMRLIPLAGYHAAEHMVVHAIEQQEPLSANVVRRMPRVHPRCGTNVGIALMVFLGIQNWSLIPTQEYRTMLAVFSTVFLYRPLGSFVQYWFTTRPPSSKQLKSGILAGEELVHLVRTQGPGRTSIPVRIFNSGLLHVMAGSTLTALLLAWISNLLGYPIPLY